VDEKHNARQKFRMVSSAFPHTLAYARHLDDGTTRYLKVTGSCVTADPNYIVIYDVKTHAPQRAGAEVSAAPPEGPEGPRESWLKVDAQGPEGASFYKPKECTLVCVQSFVEESEIVTMTNQLEQRRTDWKHYAHMAQKGQELPETCDEMFGLKVIGVIFDKAKDVSSYCYDHKKDEKMNMAKLQQEQREDDDEGRVKEKITQTIWENVRVAKKESGGWSFSRGALELEVPLLPTDPTQFTDNQGRCYQLALPREKGIPDAVVESQHEIASHWSYGAWVYAPDFGTYKSAAYSNLDEEWNVTGKSLLEFTEACDGLGASGKKLVHLGEAYFSTDGEAAAAKKKGFNVKRRRWVRQLQEKDAYDPELAAENEQAEGLMSGATSRRDGYEERLIGQLGGLAKESIDLGRDTLATAKKQLAQTRNDDKKIGQMNESLVHTHEALDEVEKSAMVILMEIATGSGPVFLEGASAKQTKMNFSLLKKVTYVPSGNGEQTCFQMRRFIKGIFGTSEEWGTFKCRVGEAALYIIDINHEYDSLCAILEYGFIKQIKLREGGVVMLQLSRVNSGTEKLSDCPSYMQFELNDAGKNYHPGWETGVITMHAGPPQATKPCNEFCNRRDKLPHDANKGECHWLGATQLVKNIVTASRKDKDGNPRQLQEGESDLTQIDWDGGDPESRTLRFNTLPIPYSKAMMLDIKNDAQKSWVPGVDAKTNAINALTQVNTLTTETKEVFVEHNALLDKQHKELVKTNESVVAADKRLTAVTKAQFGDEAVEEEK